MAITAKADSGQTFDPISEGVHLAVCYSVIDLGDQWSEQFQKKARKVQIVWELPQETFLDTKDNEEKPRVISKEYTLSLSEKSNLRRDLQAWRGKAFSDEELAGFDLVNVLGKACQIQIIHVEKNGNKYSNIAGIMAAPKGTKQIVPYNTAVYFDLNDTIEKVEEQLKQLPEWIQEKIKKSDTYTLLKHTPTDAPDELIGDESIPF